MNNNERQQPTREDIAEAAYFAGLFELPLRGNHHDPDDAQRMFVPLARLIAHVRATYPDLQAWQEQRLRAIAKDIREDMGFDDKGGAS